VPQVNDKPWTTPVVQAVAGDGQPPTQAGWYRAACFKTLKKYNSEKYRLEHGLGCGPNHKPGDPVSREDLYFVLNVTHDPHARVALLAYAASVEAVNPDLAGDLSEILDATLAIDRDCAARAAGAFAPFIGELQPTPLLLGAALALMYEMADPTARFIDCFKDALGSREVPTPTDLHVAQSIAAAVRSGNITVAEATHDLARQRVQRFLAYLKGAIAAVERVVV